MKTVLFVSKLGKCSSMSVSEDLEGEMTVSPHCWFSVVVSLSPFLPFPKVLVEKCPRISTVVFIGSPHLSDCAFKALSSCNLKKIRFEGL